MACCGQRRQQMRSQATPVSLASDRANRAGFSQATTQQRSATFQYVGKTALTAVGPVSGRHYRFNCFGAVVEIDPRDTMSLATVPNLRQIRRN